MPAKIEIIVLSVSIAFLRAKAALSSASALRDGRLVTRAKVPEFQSLNKVELEKFVSAQPRCVPRDTKPAQKLGPKSRRISGANAVRIVLSAG